MGVPVETTVVDFSFTETSLGPGDDHSTGSPVAVGFSLNFFGQTYNQVYVNNNGNVTFNSSLGSYTPFGLGQDYQGQPIIAPFFADVDTRGENSGVTAFGVGTYDDHAAFGVTWPGVGYYAGNDDKVNTFQLILTDRSDTGSGNFDIYFNYQSIQWETGDASGGAGGIGGVPAAAGYSNGTGVAGSYYQLPGSLTSGAFLDSNTATGLANNTNNDVTGQYVFHVRNGLVIVPGGNEEPPAPPPPVGEVSFGLGSMGPVREGDQGGTPFAFVISRSGDIQHASSVDWSVSADASDLVAGQPLSGTIGFAPGQTAAIVTILIQGDKVFEPDETFFFSVTSASHNGMTWDPGLMGTAIILNDDLPNTFRFGEPVMLREGMSGQTPFDFVVQRTGDLTQAATVKWRLENVDTDDSDFGADQAREGVATFAAGSATATIHIKVAGDTQVELDEKFALKLTEASVGGSTATLANLQTTATILDDDGRRTVLIASPSSQVKSEGDAGTTDFNFGITRVGDLSKAVTLTYTISSPANGGLSASEIQGPLTGTISFGVGATDATISVHVAGDTTAEGNESFLVSLGGGEYNALTLTGVVLNDDGIVGAPAPVSAPPSSATEDSNPSTFMQHLMGGSLWGDGGI
jgi:hypothetical protein